MLKIGTAVFSALMALNLSAQTPCENGIAGTYPCQNIALASFMAIDEIGGGQNLNDNWGWTDPDSGREFALVGRSNGTSFVEITDPYNPVYLGNLATHTTPSLWRDLKVFDHYVFIVSEAGDHGMQVFDLERLLDVESPPEQFTPDAHYPGYGNAHNIAICTESGFAYGVGTNTASGGLHIVDINDPLNPVLAGLFAEDGYTHDAQVVIYDGPDASYSGREIAFACNEDEVSIIDCSDKTDINLVGKEGYAQVGYLHQGWLTEDHRYFVVNDETDETNGFTATTRTHVFDVSDLENPVYVGFYAAEVSSSDHNLYTLGDYVVMGNYRSGVRITQMLNPASAYMIEVGFFDTEIFSDDPGFTGVWNVYPYFESEVLVASDMFNGLFFLDPDYEAMATVNVSEIQSQQSHGLKLFPNPAQDGVTVSFTGLHPAEVRPLTVRDATGRVIDQHDVNPAGQVRIALNTAGYAAGVYTVQWSDRPAARLIIE